MLVIGMFPMTSVIATPNPDDASSWAQDGIAEALKKGFIPSDLQSNYTKVITRQEFCRMAVKWLEYAAGKPIDTILSERSLSRNSNAFIDTNNPDILAAFALGVTSGVGNNQFNPTGQFNREQAATMIMNTIRALGIDVSTPPPSNFTDMSEAATWAHAGIDFVRAHGIMQGTGNNNFSPRSLYTREQSIITFNNINHRALLGGEQPSISDLISAGAIDAIQDDDGNFRVIDGIFTNMLVNSERDAANVLNVYSDLFDGDFTANLSSITLQRVGEDTSRKESFYRYSSDVKGVPVLGSQIILATNGSGVVQGMFSSYDYRINNVNTVPTITSANARDKALQACISSQDVSSVLSSLASGLGINRSELESEFLSVLTSETGLFVHAGDSDEEPALVWVVYIEMVPEESLDSDVVFFDEESILPLISMTYYIYANGSRAGQVLTSVSNILDWTSVSITSDDLLNNSRTISAQSENGRYRLRDNERNLETYNTTFSRKFSDLWIISTPNLPGSIVSGAMGGNPSKSSVSAHTNKAIVYDYYKNVLGRNSYDGYGRKIVTSIGYSTSASTSYSNAFWMTSKKQFGYGNAGNFEAALDVVAHEFTHAVINYVVGNGGSTYLGSANYSNSEAGALNEAYCDIMGGLIEGKTGNGRWTMAEDSSRTIRDMSITRHYSEFGKNRACCHTNSGIFSHAAYLMMIDSRTSSISKDTWAQVFYRSLYRLATNAKFSDASGAVITSAKSLGFTESQQQAIEDAFVTVGIRPPTGIVGTWVGSYMATQGETGLTLTVYSNGTAIFDFYNIPGRSNAKAGRYIMSVGYNSSTGEYSLVGKEWIDHPSGWVFADLHGIVEGSSFSGRVNNSSSWPFDLTKVSDADINLPSEIVGTWEGSYTATQGETGLTLTVYSNGTARFEFYNLPGHTNSKNGQYTMTVNYNSGTGEYSLVGRDWIDRPSGYSFVSLFGFVDGSSFTGRSSMGTNANWHFSLRKI